MRYEIVPGFFLQDDPRADAGTVGSIPPSFGLLSKLPSDWSEFTARIANLNSSASTTGASYKVLFLGRHGQGYHNAAVLKYGRKEWDNKWSLLSGDGETAWGRTYFPSPIDSTSSGIPWLIGLGSLYPADADLTPLGQSQASNLNAAWKMELSRGMPSPQKLYCSPMTRALRTCMITFDGVLPNNDVRPLILENLREWYGRNPCDKRSTRSTITAGFPSVEFEEGFVEEDELWTTERESKTHLKERVTEVLDGVFQADKNEVYISITAHGGFFRVLLDLIGRGEYAIPPGGIVPVVIKRSLEEDHSTCVT